MRFTAASMFGSKNGSLSDFRRGRRNAWTSSALAKPFRISNRAIHSQPQISLHEIGAPFRSSGGIRIQLARTDYFICGLLADKTAVKHCRSQVQRETEQSRSQPRFESAFEKRV